MNLEKLKEIIRLFQESSLTSLEVEEEGIRYRLKRDGHRDNSQGQVSAGSAKPPYSGQTAQPEQADGGPDFNRITEVKSPVVGIFYEAPEPGAKPFVQVGDRVKKDDVLCLIEVMKQVTEVTAPKDGQVVDICLSNGSVVEFGQTLMKLC